MLLHIYQHLPEHIDPIAFHLGPIAVSWYGLMYAVGFAILYFLARRRIRTEKIGIPLETVQDFFPWMVIGLLLGGRLGDVFIYDWDYFHLHPSEIFLPFNIHNHWQYIGIYGMSYFGGVAGVAIAFLLFCRIKKISLFRFTDLFAPAIPLAYAFGRLGNFINGELYGRATSRPWGMYFPADFTHQLRHPSQVYELFLEGLVLFAILWPVRKFNWPPGYLAAFYLIGYGLARFTAEFFRQPDNDWFFLSLTLGQWLSIGIIILAFLIIYSQNPKNRKNA
ncbi:MAG: prolipoprotein diacylglyceryl transferase [Candidatus Moranbacteria bacterium]|nr:prolipoprotein diacylglyceryl transferase [Candidatus Moranbacteria bacterium]